MQWLIDIIYEKVMLHFKGTILLWSGAVADIPEGWHLCNGMEGTPNLRNRFIIGAGLSYPVGGTGGSTIHSHTISAGYGIGPGTYYAPYAAPASGIPPYYALCYIMKL